MSSAFTFKEMLDSVYDRVDDMEVIGRSLTETDLPTRLYQLIAVQSCVAIGAGFGRLDMLLMKHCLPNVTELTVVEPDAASIVELKKTFAEQFPNVRSVFCQETVQSWSGVDKPIDSVLLSHFLYYLKSKERLALFQRLFGTVLHSGSYVFVLTHMPYDGGEPSAYFRAIHAMNDSGQSVQLPTDGSVRETMAAVGFELCYERVYVCHMNVENMDDTFLSLLFSHFGDCDLEKARLVANEVFADAKRVRHDSWLGVFKKP